MSMSPQASISPSSMVAMLVVWGGLAVWPQLAVGAGCELSAMFLLLLWGIMLLATTEWALLQRSVFIRQYLNQSGALARWLRGRIFLLFWHGLKTLLPALVLTVTTLTLGPMQWFVLLLDIILLTGLFMLLTRLLRNELAPRLGILLVRQWAHRINALLLWLGLVAVLFFSAHENYTGMAWESVVQYRALDISLGCDALAILARLNEVGEAMLWWAAQNRLTLLEHPQQVALAWLGFLAAFGVSLVTAWAYSRLLLGVLARPWRIDLLKASTEAAADSEKYTV